MSRKHLFAFLADVAGRWDNRNGNPYFTANTLYLGSCGSELAPPMVLRHVRLDDFRAVFKVIRQDTTYGRGFFVFNAKDPHTYNCIEFYHSQDKTAPYSAIEIVDGGVSNFVSYDTRDDNKAVDRATASAVLWVCVDCLGGTLSVREAADTQPSNWDNVDPCYTTANFQHRDGGQIGFTCGRVYIDDFTVMRRQDGAWTPVVTDGFGIDGNGYAASKPTHDAAGNLTYDGALLYTYDAWNRLTKVWIDEGDGTLNATGKPDTQIAALSYDGLGRRTRKAITNLGDRSCTYNEYYDNSWRRIEERDGSNQVLRQYVWGARYIDNIVQIGVNTDPTDTEQDCEEFYYPIQDANFNVMGLVNSSGVLQERYEYTPYGERTVYTNAGSNDTLTSGPLSDSERVKVTTIDQAYSLCDLGHQGLFLDKEYGLYYNRHRDYHPRLGRWMQRDPGGAGRMRTSAASLGDSTPWAEYADGMSLSQYVWSRPIFFADPSGLGFRQRPTNWEGGTEPTVIPVVGDVVGGLYDIAFTAAITNLSAPEDYTLPPYKSGTQFASPIMCCLCYSKALAWKAGAEARAERYMKAGDDPNLRTRAQIEAEVDRQRQQKQTGPGSGPEYVGGETWLLGARMVYVPSGPCGGLRYQAFAEHERSHWEDRNALVSMGRSGILNPRSEWDKGRFAALSEGRAYDAEAEFLGEFTAACLALALAGKWWW